MERNNSDAGEILAELSILSEMPNGQFEFGNRIQAIKNNDVISFSSLSTDYSIIATTTTSDIVKLRDALKAELLVKKSMRGKVEYNSINQFGALLGNEDCLVAPVGRVDDFVLNGKAINFKASIQNKAGVLHYSKLFAFRFRLCNVTDKQAQEYQTMLLCKERTPTEILKELISKNYITIVSHEFCVKESDSLTFFDFLHSLDPALPGIYQKLKYRQVELSKHKPMELLTDDELTIFGKFVEVINHGLTTTNFIDFQPQQLSLIVMTRQLNMIYHTLDQPEDIEWMMKHLYVDSGDASRTGSGKIYQENDVWYMTADIYFKFDYHE